MHQRLEYQVAKGNQRADMAAKEGAQWEVFCSSPSFMGTTPPSFRTPPILAYQTFTGFRARVLLRS
jgi:hypothetical protein